MANRVVQMRSAFRFYGAGEYIAEVFPKSSGDNFIRAISGLTSFRGDWRVGRNGLAKLVRDTFNETQEIPLSEKVFLLGWRTWVGNQSYHLQGYWQNRYIKNLRGILLF